MIIETRYPVIQFTQPSAEWYRYAVDIDGVSDLVWNEGQQMYDYTGFLALLCEWAPEGIGYVMMLAAVVDPEGGPTDYRAQIVAGEYPNWVFKQVRVTQYLFTMICSLAKNNANLYLDPAITSIELHTGDGLFVPTFDEQDESTMEMHDE